MPNIMKIRKDKEVDIRGGIVLDGFPSAGVINSIASRNRACCDSGLTRFSSNFNN